MTMKNVSGFICVAASALLLLLYVAGRFAGVHDLGLLGILYGLGLPLVVIDVLSGIVFLYVRHKQIVGQMGRPAKLDVLGDLGLLIVGIGAICIFYLSVLLYMI